MEAQIKRAMKLIEHKKKYLERCENPKTANAIKMEINIIETLLFGEDNYKNLSDSLNKKLTEQKIKNEILRIICELHGVDLAFYSMTSLETLIWELERDKSENIKRIPHQLIKTFYGEKN